LKLALGAVGAPLSERQNKLARLPEADTLPSVPRDPGDVRVVRHGPEHEDRALGPTLRGRRPAGGCAEAASRGTA